MALLADYFDVGFDPARAAPDVGPTQQSPIYLPVDKGHETHLFIPTAQCQYSEGKDQGKVEGVHRRADR